jgi:hypothetical protein
MSQKQAIKAVESRAFAVRMTVTELCAAAGVPQPSWSRAKRRGTISVKTLRAMEETLAEIEARREQAAA